MHIEIHILVKKDSRFPHMVTADENNAIHGKYSPSQKFKTTWK